MDHHHHHHHHHHRPYAARGGYNPDHGGRGGGYGAPRGGGFGGYRGGGGDFHRPPPRTFAPRIHVDEGQLPPVRTFDLEPPQKPMSEYNDNVCVRFGVVKSRSPLTRDQVMSEIDSIKMCSKVDQVFIEEETDEPKDGGRYDYARVYFNNSDEADHCAAEINAPNRPSRWRQFFTQRLPLPGPFSGDVGGDPVFEAFVHEPADTLVVDMQEGLIAFSTDELYRTKGAEDFLQAKSIGRTIRRLICKHFDPLKKINCRYGTACQFVHVKAEPMLKILRTACHKQPLRFPKNEEDIQQSAYEYDRRSDTLVVRDLNPEVGLTELEFMFAGCPGYLSCLIRQIIQFDKRYGLVRFDGREHAFQAMEQTFDVPGMSVSFYGTMEDIRMLQMKDRHAAQRDLAEIERATTVVPQRRQQPTEKRLREEDETKANGNGEGQNDTNTTTGQAAAPAVKAQRTTDDASAPGMVVTPKKVPFPDLPEGWDYGVSRRTSQYYFYQRGAKDKTSWKHPVSGETYSSKPPSG